MSRQSSPGQQQGRQPAVANIGVASMPTKIEQCTPEQIAMLPALPDDARKQIEEFTAAVHKRFKAGGMKQEEAALQLQRMQIASDK